jgi:hypothetical protein
MMTTSLASSLFLLLLLLLLLAVLVHLALLSGASACNLRSVCGVRMLRSIIIIVICFLSVHASQKDTT